MLQVTKSITQIWFALWHFGLFSHRSWLYSDGIIMLAYLLVLGLLIGIAFYRWATANSDYFVKRGLPYIRPKFLMGTTGSMLMKLYHMDDWMRWLYNAYPTARCVYTNDIGVRRPCSVMCGDMFDW